MCCIITYYNFYVNKISRNACLFQIKAYLCIRNSGCSSARLEYASGGRVVAGSNPVTPTAENQGVKINILTPFF